MKIYLIRHGRQCSKLCNVDVDLAEEGYRQAALLGERLAGAKIEKVYSSDYLRAVQTAQTANLYWNVEHVIDERLREISFGDMEGLSDEVIAERFCEFKKEFAKMESDMSYPNGECAADVVKRVLPVMEEVTASGCKEVAMVVHGGVIRTFVTWLLGMDLAKWRMLGNSLENCSITELSWNPKSGYSLERFNDYAHLEAKPELLRAAWVDAEN
ncbi:MAG: histidine phosphatase family protein [bacterium]|nr:histidine phosphatase family protein [bacterium]